MSAQPIAQSSTVQANAAAAAARVTALQQMLAETANGFSSTATTSTASSGASQSSATPDFSTVLASAAAEPTTASTGSASEYSATIDQAAAQYGINPALLSGLIQQESGFDPNAVSSAGAEGLTQVMPENFAADGISNPFDPTQSIDGGAKQLSEDLSEFNGNVSDALAAYNAGSAAVKEYGGVPPYSQTQNYVSDVLADAEQYEQQSATTSTGTADSTTASTGVVDSTTAVGS